MLHPEYIKDMQNSYLLLKSMEGNTIGYGSKMLVYNKISGLLKVEIRCFDELNVYYYDISGKKNILDHFDNTSLKFVDLKHILTCVINILEGSLEYLLSGNDFIIEPGYVFIEPNTNEIYLCHLVGYQVDVQTQISSFIEYLMNKVDYKDEKAVLLVYSLYKESREANCTYEKLLSELNNKSGDNKEIRITDKKQIEKSPNPHNSTQRIAIKDEKINLDVMPKKGKDDKYNLTRKAQRKEVQNGVLQNGVLQNGILKNGLLKNEALKNEVKEIKERSIKKATDSSYKHLLPEAIGEEETMCYCKTTYLMAALSLCLCGILFILALIAGLLHNTFKTQLDPIKVISFLVILGAIEVYVLCKLFQDSYKITKMVPTINYESGTKIESKDQFESIAQYESNNLYNSENQYDSNDLLLERAKDDIKESRNEKEVSRGDIEDIDKTVNLYEDKETNIISDVTEALVFLEPKLLLKPLDKDNYKYINLSRFPFLVGKNQKIVNHYFNNNTISRIHSKFEKKGDDIYLVDLDSLNGTFVNGDRLVENQPCRISAGDKISFAHLNYIFQIE